MNLHVQACDAFLADVNAFVDDELGEARLTDLATHTTVCGDCREYVDTLRELSSLHRRSARQSDQAAADGVDAAALLDGVTGCLLEERRDALARLFYEIGKAYVLTGNTSLGEQRRQPVSTAAPATEIRGAETRARQVLREAGRLDAARTSGAGSLFKRSRRLFSTRGGSALLRGRRFLEEALALRPELDEARLYLGFHWSLAGRPDRARVQFRQVHATAGDPLHRLMAMQWLGNLYVHDGDYHRAIECYEQVVASEVGEEPRLLSSFLNLPVTCAKAGRLDEAVRRFADLAVRFPRRIPQIRGMLDRMQAFARLLQSNASFRHELHLRVPVLFAA